MKKLGILLCAILGSMLLLTSCEGASMSGDAPKNIAGKKLTMYDEDRDVGRIMHFLSNSSAVIYEGPAYGGEQIFFESIKYEKTGYNTATIRIKGQYRIINGSATEKRDVDYSLVFISPSQGTVSGNTRMLTFTLF